MKVFISWSGSRSRAIAEVLRAWLPSVLQAVRPYFSPDDVTKGSRWSSEIAKELESSRVALMVITPENQEAPWLLFEAGALSKNLDRSKVCPLLFDGMDPTDVKGPLVQFQAAKFSKEEMKRVLKMVNAELGELALLPDVLDNVLDMWWPKLEEQVADKLVENDEFTEATRRSERDLLEEVLALTRSISSDRHRKLDLTHPAIDDLIAGVGELCNVIREYAPAEVSIRMLTRIVKPIDYIVRRSSGSRAHERGQMILRGLKDSLEILSTIEHRIDPTAVIEMSDLPDKGV